MMYTKKNRLSSMLFLFSLLICSPLFATTFYVDATNGSDSNSGTSTSSAWKSAAKAQSTTLQAGDSLLFKRGETFKGPFSIYSSGTAGNPITIGAYGDGERPIISAIGSYNHTFTSQGGNVWKATNPPGALERLASTSQELLRTTSVSNLNAKYNWYFDGNLYLYSVQDISNTVLRYSKTSVGFTVSKRSYLDIQDIRVDGGNRVTFSLSSSSNINLTNVQVGNLSRVAMSAGGNNNVVIDSCVFDSQFTLHYFDAGDETSTQRGTDDALEIGNNSSNIEIKNSLFRNWGHASMNVYADPASGNGIQNVKIHHNELTAPDMAYGGRLAIDGNSHHMEIYNNYIHDVSNPSQVNGHDNHFHHNIIDGVIRTPLHLSRKAGKGIAVQSYVAPVYNNIYENNLFMNTDDEGIYGSANYGKGDIYDNIIRNNIFYNCGRLNNGLMIKFNPSTHLRNNTITHNVFYAPLAKNTFAYHDLKNPLTLAQWEASPRNGDIINNNSDQMPEFVSLADKNYHLADNSIFLTTGTKPKAVLDFSAQPIDAAYAIGAYETSIGGVIDTTSPVVTAAPSPVIPPDTTTKTGPWIATPPQAGGAGVLE